MLARDAGETKGSARGLAQLLHLHCVASVEERGCEALSLSRSLDPDARHGAEAARTATSAAVIARR